MVNPQKLKKILVLIPTFALVILVIRNNYNWIFGILIGAAIAMSSCELIQKAVKNSFVRKRKWTAKFFLIGFFFRFILFAALLYMAIVYFQVNPIAIVLSFTFLQLIYPFYIVQTLEK